MQGSEKEGEGRLASWLLGDGRTPLTGRIKLTTSFNVHGGYTELGEVPWCRAVQAFVGLNQQAELERDTVWHAQPVGRIGVSPQSNFQVLAITRTAACMIHCSLSV